jgi:hypothetical protein
MSFNRWDGPHFKTPKLKNGTAAGRKHMARVAKLNCVICHSWPVEVHHVCSERYSSAKASDFETIPLCFNHHRGPEGIHTDKAAWEAKHRVDWSYLAVVQLALKGTK